MFMERKLHKFKYFEQRRNHQFWSKLSWIQKFNGEKPVAVTKQIKIWSYLSLENFFRPEYFLKNFFNISKTFWFYRNYYWPVPFNIMVVVLIMIVLLTTFTETCTNKKYYTKTVQFRENFPITIGKFSNKNWWVSVSYFLSVRYCWANMQKILSQKMSIFKTVNRTKRTLDREFR